MGAIFLYAIVPAVLCFIFLRNFVNHKNTAGLTNWPLLGMLPGILSNYGRSLDHFVELVNGSPDGVFLIKGPWWCNLDMLITCDPDDVQYMASTKSSNFIRGPKSKKNFDLLGDSVFNAEGAEWSYHLRIVRGFFNASSEAPQAAIDLQELFQRFFYDLSSQMICSHDPNSLSLQWPDLSVVRALSQAMEVVYLRHILPESVWKIQRMLELGEEKKMKRAEEILHSVASQLVSKKHEQLASGVGNDYDLITTYINGDKEFKSGKNDELLEATVIATFLAGTNTVASALTSLFWLLSQNPAVESKIKDELKENVSEDKKTNFHVCNREELSKLVYLQATVCEVLRLYPPVPTQTRSSLEQDCLPTGHQVDPKMTILISVYAMGRLRSLWGEDCLEFKPERWITDSGEIKYESPHKFFTFNSGSRICLGKDLALFQMKALATTMLLNYDVQVINGQDAAWICSIIPQMKHGLYANISKRLSPI
ncbi:Alkane hydroxylase MAH1-like protein [Drosera capensis]